METTIVCDTSHQIECVSFCPRVYDGEDPLIAVSSSSLEGSLWGGALSLIDSGTGESLCSMTFDCGISTIAWCGLDYNIIACGGDDGIIRLINNSMDVDIKFLSDPKEKDENGHDDIVSCLSTSSINPFTFVSGSFDFNVKLWDISTIQTCVQTLQGHVGAVWDIAWNPLSNAIASASQDRSVQIWDIRQDTSSISILTDHAACSIDWHPTLEHVLTTGLEDGAVVTYDIRSPSLPIHVMTEHTGCIYNVKYSPIHEDLLVSASDDTTIRFIQGAAIGSATVQHTYSAHTDYVRALGWSTTRNVLATGSWDKSLHIMTCPVV